MRCKSLIMLLCVCLVMTFVSGAQSPTKYTFDMLPSPTFDNNTAFVNQSQFWNTLTLGPLDDANSAQFDNIGGTLTIDESHIELIGNVWWLRRDGTNSPTADIDWNGNSLFNVFNLNMTNEILIEFDSSNFENSSINIINSNDFGISSQRFANSRGDEFFISLLGFNLSQALFSGIIDDNDSIMGLSGDGVMFLGTLRNRPILFGSSPNNLIPNTDWFFRLEPEIKALVIQGDKFIRPVQTNNVQTMVFESDVGAAEGEITFAFIGSDSINQSVAQHVYQIGKNNSASVQGMNSQIVATKDFLTMPANVKAQFDNNTGDPIIEEWFSNITNCLIYEEFLQGLGLLDEGLSNVCDTVDRLVPQSILGDLEVVRSFVSHESLTAFNDFDYITRVGNDMDILGGDVHIRKNQNVTGNFTTQNQTICNFDAGNICNFVSESIAPEIGRDWNDVLEDECHLGRCANAKGGNLKVMCEDGDYTNLENINVSFWLSSFLSGGDSLNITLDDNLGNTSTVFTETTIVNDTLNSFVFSSTFENKSNVTMCLELDGQNSNREAWVDEIEYTSDLIIPGIVNQTEEQGAMWFGENGDSPNKCGVEVFFETNDTTQDVQKVMQLGCPTGITRILGSVEQVDVTIIDQNITGNQEITGNSTIGDTLIVDRIINRTLGGINMSTIVRIEDLFVNGENISNIYLRLDGTTPLTANWDAGNFNISTDFFIGDGSQLTGIVHSVNGTDINVLTINSTSHTILGNLTLSDGVINVTSSIDPTNLVRNGEFDNGTIWDLTLFSISTGKARASLTTFQIGTVSQTVVGMEVGKVYDLTYTMEKGGAGFNPIFRITVGGNSLTQQTNSVTAFTERFTAFNTADLIFSATSTPFANTFTIDDVIITEYNPNTIIGELDVDSIFTDVIVLDGERLLPPFWEFFEQSYVTLVDFKAIDIITQSGNPHILRGGVQFISPLTPSGGTVVEVFQEDEDIEGIGIYNEVYSEVNAIMTMSGKEDGRFEMGTNNATNFSFFTNGSDKVRMKILGDGDILIPSDNKFIRMGNSPTDFFFGFDGTDAIFNVSGSGAFVFSNGTGLGKLRALEYATSTPKDLSYDIEDKYIDTLPTPENLLDNDGKIKRGTFRQAEATWQEKDYNNCSEVFDYELYCYEMIDRDEPYCRKTPIKNWEEIRNWENKTEVLSEEIRNITRTECGTKDVNVTLIDTQAFENTVMISELKQENDDLRVRIERLETSTCAIHIFGWCLV